MPHRDRLIKIYTRFEKITTLADNFLAFVCVGYFIATVLAYLALRSHDKSKKAEARQDCRHAFSDFAVLHRLAVALFMTFALAG